MKDDDGVNCKGRSLRAFRNAARSKVTCSTSADDLRSSSVAVKKNVPPGSAKASALAFGF
jgi:hypothetical protein